MLIERVKTQNFGPFYKTHEIVFPGDGSGVHIIRGGTGQGKTSLHRAILWGLYGKVKDRKGQDIRPTSLLNRTSFREDIYQMSVAIQFSHEGQAWALTRRMEARTHADHNYLQGMKVSLVRDGEPVQNPEQEIRRILPEEVSRFFFFDGEMLADYEELLDQTSRSMALLRNSIELVLGIPILRIARDDLLAVQRNIESERTRAIRRMGRDTYEQLVNDYQAISSRIEERETETKELDRQMRVLDVEIADGKRKLTSISSVKELAEQRIQHEERIKLLETSRSREEEGLKRLLSGLHKTILFQSSEEILESLRAKHTTVMERYNKKQQLVGEEVALRKGIEAQKCRMCGTVLNPVKLKELREDLKRIQVEIKNLTDVPEPNLEFEEYANRLEALQPSLIHSKDFSAIDARLTEIDHDLAATRAKRDGCVEQLSGVDEDEPRRLQLEISHQTEEFGRLKGLKERADQDQLEDLAVKAELDQQIKSIDAVELSVLGKRIEIVTPLVQVFEQAIAAYREERRQYVGKVASDIFKELKTKPDFSALEINQQFGLNIILNTGHIVLDRAEWRSSGEEQVVALSMIGALNRCARARAPVFMDTAIARLDLAQGKRILTFVPKFSEQVVMFVTSREFTPADEAIITAHIRSDHTLVYGGEGKGSRIVATRALAEEMK